ncbi:MAG: OmpA family protein [Deltaproteobacteria bacterium]|jgi:flagellar motor protein MotB|nr:OmpA family protein [Deltaproteobacteria bacterium]
MSRFLIGLCLGLAVTPGAAVASGFWSLEPPAETRNPGARGEAVEKHLSQDQPFQEWVLDPGVYGKDQGDRIEMQQVVEPDVQTVKLDNLVPPILFPLGVADIPDDYIDRLRTILDSMRDRDNVRLHFVGHTDNLQLFGDVKETFGDNIGLSRERAGTTAEYFQQVLNLPPEAISYEGLGESQPVASNETEAGRAQNRRVEVQVWYDEIGEKQTEQEIVIPQDVNRVKVCRTETVCKLRYKDGHTHRAKVKNLVAPLHYNLGSMTVSDHFLNQVKQAVQQLEHKQNLVVKFISYSDGQELTGRDRRIYGTPEGLSKAIARRTALAVQDALALPNEALAIEGRGSTRPVASNETAMGRSLNRRVEVEFWYDDPLQDLPDEPQLCPDAAGAETVTRVYDPPTGRIKPLYYQNGTPLIPAGYIDRLQQVMAEISDRDNVRLRFVGYTSNEPMDRRNAAIYGDDIGWSTARAHRALLAVANQMEPNRNHAEFEGRGYVQSDDVVNTGFIESDTSRVEVQVVYDELVPLDDYEGVEITRLTREVEPVDPFRLNLMRITVDGTPLDDPEKSIPDVQRCIDVALDDAQVQFSHDTLTSDLRLNVTAWPRTVRSQDDEKTPSVEDLVRFRLYTNYHHFIDRAEVRVFGEHQSLHDAPLAIVDLDSNGQADWQLGQLEISPSVQKLTYLVRVYDAHGNYDQTHPQPIWVVNTLDEQPSDTDADRELLVGYGENRLARQTIPVHGGTVRAQGSAIPEGHDVWMAGTQVPVDDNGRFLIEEVLPKGMHTVEIAVLDSAGNGELFLRDLDLPQDDWFYVGIADLTLSAQSTDDQAEQVAPGKDRYSDDASLDGRLAFYTKGQFGDGWELKASADTREAPLDDIFSNFLDKTPDALFRRIDPKYHYPTFGDDSTVIDDAPTNGKFFLKLSKDHNFGLWGSFQVAYTETDLTQVDRGLYGANLHYQGADITSFGEQRLMIDGFAADPGTVSGRDEFQGTGGSLYYLRHQDILEGSDRMRIEVRDKDTGIVLKTKSLTPTLDYTVDYLQGRVLLSQPLQSTADDDLLVHTESLSGHPVYLVARYEFTPGVNDLDTLATGGRAHYWVNDHLKVGVTASQSEEEDEDNDLYGADVTIRQSAQTWLKLETGRSKGVGTFLSTSKDGGLDFDAPVFVGGSEAEAWAYRADASVGFADLFANGRGRFTVYFKDVEAGYLAPGQVTERDTTQYGGTLTVPWQSWVNIRLKADHSEQTAGLQSTAGEIDLDLLWQDQWTLSTGVRHDSRDDDSTIVPLTQEEGDRTDAIVQVLYDSLTRWTAYGFLQETLQTTGNRDDNFRVGAGGSYQLTNRFKIVGEISGGDLGTGGQVGTEFLYSDRTTVYLNYALENERTDNGVRARKGNMTSGFRTRYSDSISVYFEERYTHGNVPSGLMHSAGLDLAPNDRLNLGGNVDYGTLKDQLTGAELERKAAGIRAGYGCDRCTLASALEYREDESEQLDASSTTRTTWLVRLDLKYQVSENWRLLGKLNYAYSDSSEGQFYDGEFTEGVLAYAYRPIENDRFNALLKYTYFYNLPAVDQVSTLGSGPGVVQRSHIAALDVSYDLTPRWTVGGKYAYRLGEVSLDRKDTDYFDSRAHLYVLRLDWHALHRWDALLEGRMLDLPDAEDRLSGVLLGVYRHLGSQLKLGVGYNFSSFSDDLTDLDYDHQGLFINLVGKI